MMTPAAVELRIFMSIMCTSVAAGFQTLQFIAGDTPFNQSKKRCVSISLSGRRAFVLVVVRPVHPNSLSFLSRPFGGAE
jgi:hypothetical protein